MVSRNNSGAPDAGSAATHHRLAPLRSEEPVQGRLVEHPRWQLVFTPTHASWLNQVEIFFSILTRRLLRHGQFSDPDDLATQMLAFVEHDNLTAKPFAWTYTGKVLAA